MQFDLDDPTLTPKQRKVFEWMNKSWVLEEEWRPKTSASRLRFYPGEASGMGFLGWGEDLGSIIAKDTARTTELGYDHMAVGTKLKQLLDKQPSRKHEVKMQGWLGYQECPFEGCRYATKMCPHSSVDFSITNRENGEVIAGPGLVWHLIVDHQFFEGQGTLRRVDPEQLIKVLFG